MRSMALAIVWLVVSAFAARADQAAESAAGNWKTWVIDSSHQFRVPTPPDATVTAKELDRLAQLVSVRDHAALDRITYWNTGGLSYRWSEIAVGEHLKNGAPWQVAARDLALMHVAIYDAMIAAWDSKYAYRRPRPSMDRADQKTALANPSYPSYPSAYAAAAGAASEVLAYIYPDRADEFRDKAKGGRAVARPGRSKLSE